MLFHVGMSELLMRSVLVLCVVACSFLLLRRDQYGSGSNADGVALLVCGCSSACVRLSPVLADRLRMSWCGSSCVVVALLWSVMPFFARFTGFRSVCGQLSMRLYIGMFSAVFRVVEKSSSYFIKTLDV